MSTQILSNKNTAGFNVLRIVSVPHESLFNDDPASNIASRKREMASLLFQIHRYISDAAGANVTAAVEMLWMTHKVDRQPYNARIEIYFVVHTMSADAKAESAVRADITSLIRSLLDSQWYEVENVDADTFLTRLMQLCNRQARTLTRECRIEPLPIGQQTNIPVFDRVTPTASDMHRFISTLTDHADVCVQFIITPQSYTAEEKTLLLQLAQIMAMAADGINENGNKISIVGARKLAELYEYYSNHRDRPVYGLDIVVWGPTSAATSIICSSIAGHIHTGESADKLAGSRSMPLNPAKLLPHKNYFYTLPWVVASSIHSYNSVASRLSNLFTIEECSELITLPVANNHIGAGITVNESGRRSRTYADGIIGEGSDLVIGTLKSPGQPKIGLRVNDLAKHMLIVGTPGSGKTTFSVGLLDRLWKEFKIPFMVIEPAKNEYRALIESIPDLQVFTPGKPDISPLIFNPFAPPKGVKLGSYKSTLLTAFAAGVSMSSPLDKIFEETITNCYADFGWLDFMTSDDKGRTINISDFIKCFEETFQAIGYKGDASNICKAGIVRLKGLVRLFDNYFSIPIEDLLSKPTVIELAAIENADQKALIIALILLGILSYINANYTGTGGLRNFILLEEAHVLLDAGTGGGNNSGNANPAQIAQGLVKRILAELRSYGVGFAIADQSPRKVGLDIVALTDIKVAFRLVEQTDKDIIAGSVSMTPPQYARLAKLRPGEAFFFFNKLEEAEETVTPDYRLEKKISISLTDKKIGELSTYWKKHPLETRPYPECCLTKLCKGACDNRCRMLAHEAARRQFRRYIAGKPKDPERVIAAVRRMPQGLFDMTGTEPEKKLVHCAQIHFWRLVRYEAKLKFNEQLVTRYLNE